MGKTRRLKKHRSRLEKAEDLVNTATCCMMEYANLIAEAESREEADKLHAVVSNGILDDLSDSIWDYFIPWDKVKWKEGKR